MRYVIPFAALVLLAAPARAADTPCTTDADCAKGEVCLAMPCSTPAMPCQEGAECPVPEPCDSTSVCTPAPWDGRCAADADCPTGFACVDVEIPCASAGCAPCTCACEAGKECPACECPPCPEPPPCEPTFEKYCQYVQKECATDADCGAGWACQAQESCSAGGGCACPDCGPDMECPPCDCPPPEPPVCEVTGHWCAVAETPCTADADCPADFQCVARTLGGDCACPPCACDPAAGPCDCPACDCGNPVQESVCLPKGWSDVGYGGTTPLPQPGEVAGTPVDDKGTVDDGTTPPTTPGTENQSGAGAATPADDTGCTATGRASIPVSLALLLMVGLAPFARRRTAR